MFRKRYLGCLAIVLLILEYFVLTEAFSKGLLRMEYTSIYPSTDVPVFTLGYIESKRFDIEAVMASSGAACRSIRLNVSHSALKVWQTVDMYCDPHVSLEDQSENGVPEKVRKVLSGEGGRAVVSRISFSPPEGLTTGAILGLALLFVFIVLLALPWSLFTTSGRK